MRILGWSLIVLALLGLIVTLMSIPSLKGWSALCIGVIGTLILIGEKILEVNE